MLLPALQRHRRRRRPLAIGHLERGGILRELTGRLRNKIFAYDEYLKILSEGTEPL